MERPIETSEISDETIVLEKEFRAALTEALKTVDESFEHVDFKRFCLMSEEEIRDSLLAFVPSSVSRFEIMRIYGNGRIHFDLPPLFIPIPHFRLYFR
jgi:hypothetical protein